jgi:hypothetical protein
MVKYIVLFLGSRGIEKEYINLFFVFFIYKNKFFVFIYNIYNVYNDSTCLG